ncbi:MAG TPA: cytochrome c1 [Stellaceae bacterium]|jgi:ubiquinol-cytochrome c reductase cytochrome c1 subunit|nr:cytochrome c1 [Stellaceae bacterium]
MPRQYVLAALAACLLVLGTATVPARAQEETPTPPKQDWSFNGVFGTYDRAALQRGFQVYKEVCSACHPVKHLYFRNLEDIGYSEDQVKGIASQAQVTDGPNDQGEMFQRPGRPSDPIPGPFANDNAARAANNGALPPDLSLITKARDGNGDYVYAILNGFKDPPANFKMTEGTYYNEYFAGHQIKMPPPLSADQVKFADGTQATVPQMAHDVVTFLSWAAEPSLEQRHRMGFKVIVFLLILTLVLYAAKRKIWARIPH